MAHGMERLITKLRNERRLEAEEYRALLVCDDGEVSRKLQEAARETALARFGNRIYIRGLIEITNICRNDCLYCGIRKSNRKTERYALDKAEILECCHTGYGLGFRTFVLQGGEMPEQSDRMIEDVCKAIHAEFPDCAITLSLGERRTESYERFFKAGATRYLLRHETHNPEHYSLLHPAEMSLEHRLQCLDTLKGIGYQTGTGIMVGSPFQTFDNIVEDIMYISDFRPEMIGIGPFIPHKDTPFAGYGTGLVDSLQVDIIGLTLKLISIFRMIFPDALIPATTALATLAPDTALPGGRELGILSGANVVMPNLSPAGVRHRYSLYDNKASTGAEAAEGLAQLEASLGRIGYRITVDRGDFSSYKTSAPGPDPCPFVPDIFQRSLAMAGKPPSAEKKLQDEDGNTDEKAESIAAMRSKIQSEREIHQGADHRLAYVIGQAHPPVETQSGNGSAEPDIPIKQHK